MIHFLSCVHWSESFHTKWDLIRLHSKKKKNPHRRLLIDVHLQSQALQALGFVLSSDGDVDSLSSDEKSDGEGKMDRMSSSSSSIASSTDTQEVRKDVEDGPCVSSFVVALVSGGHLGVCVSVCSPELQVQSWRREARTQWWSWMRNAVAWNTSWYQRVAAAMTNASS